MADFPKLATAQSLSWHNSKPAGELFRVRRVPAYVCIGDVRIDASIEEASGQDVLLSLRHRPPLGQLIEVAFQPKVPTVELTVPGVVHWVDAGQDEFRAGVALQSPVPRDFLIQHPGCERSAIRYTCRVPGEVTWNLGQQSSRAIAVNYSRRGVCLHMKVMPETGVAFRFSWLSPAPHRVLGTVCWVISEGPDFLVGCELNQGLGYSLSGIPVVTGNN